jgi:hypothetical protein
MPKKRAAGRALFDPACRKSEIQKREYYRRLQQVARASIFGGKVRGAVPRRLFQKLA